MAVEHIQENDTLNAGRVKINQAIDLSNDSSKKVDQYAIDLDQGIKDAKKIATDAGQAAKTTADTAAAEAKQTASNAATEATNIAKVAGQEAKTIAETAGTEANKKADQAIADSKTAVDTSNQAVGRANQNKQEFDALRNEFDDLVAESGDSNPEIVQARTDTQGVKQNTLQNRLIADFGTRITNADAMKLFSGPVAVPKMMDLAGKVADNTVANPHSVYTDYTATSLKKPSATWTEITQENYNKLVGRDDQGVSVGANQGSVIPQLLDKSDTVRAIEELAPRIFEGMSVEQKVKYMKDNFISLSLTIRAKATSPNNKNLKVGMYLESTDSYTTKIQGDATDFTDFTVEINDNNFIDSKGFVNVIVYCDSSNGVTAANINVDYIGVQLKVSLNPLTVLNKSGFANEGDLALKANQQDLDNHIADKNNPHEVNADQLGVYTKDEVDENFAGKTDVEQTYAKKTDVETNYAKLTDLTKSKVGLGNVPNYSAANETESIDPEIENKLMTPKGVALFVDNVNKVAEYKITDKSQVPDANAATWIDTLEGVFKRRGDRVDFFCRINFNRSTGIYTPGYFKIPQGFRLSTEFDDFIWNVPLAMAKYVNADEYRGVAFAERRGTNFIRIGNKVTGNHWVSGSWYTDDPFPSVAGS
ncbi:hypothetical protein [Enterococcus raffinosus]|uniref:Uncharacterized protein n=1 Tax=Enterococcus raffinosus TaxID=71452 RepID=A0AAW8STP3_9ENTE|nr:hypothetical protein [Enterococcus raffinosus]MDT2538205.1 hypothetical protein [Enterococcus raffinosus]